MRPVRPHHRTIFAGAVVILFSLCIPQIVAQAPSLALAWVEHQAFSEVLSLAMSDDAPRLFSRQDLAKALVRSGSSHSQVEREIALAALVERTPASEAGEVLSAILPMSEEFMQWSLYNAVFRLINRSPEMHHEAQTRGFVASTLETIALTLSEHSLPPAATSTTLAAIEAARRLGGATAAESLRLIAQHSRDAEVVTQARAVARELLGNR